MSMTRWVLAASAYAFVVFPWTVHGQYVMENLGRGVVAIRTNEASVYVGWRLLGTDPTGIAFNVYRATGADAPIKLNDAPLVTTTDFVDGSADLTRSNAYSVRPVLSGAELPSSAPFVLAANPPIQGYLTVPLDRPAGGNVEVPPESPTSPFTYSPNDASAADLDGDGEYELVVKWEPSNTRDNAQAGISGRQLIDAYRLDGTKTMAHRSRPEHPFRTALHAVMVYDLDGDGRAEIACKTADGTVDGVGGSSATRRKTTARCSFRRTASR